MIIFRRNVCKKYLFTTGIKYLLIFVKKVHFIFLELIYSFITWDLCLLFNQY